MAVTSIIKLSEFEGAKRIDAEYYQPFFSSLENDLKNVGYDLLKKYSEKVFSGPFGSTLKSECYQESGIPFIKIGNIVDIFISKQSLVYISEKEHKRILSTHLNPRDIVFSKIGTIGRLSVISEDLGQVNISENNIGIRFHQLPIYERIFILFFLFSRYGQAQILRRASGNVQPKLNVKDIESIKIPRIGDETKIELAEKYKQMYALYNQSVLLYSQAEKLLLEKLGLKDFKQEYQLSYSANLSKVFGVHRIDAEYFQPMYRDIENHLVKEFDAKSIRMSNFIDVTTGQYAQKYVEKSEGRPYIRGTNIKSGSIETSGLLYIDPKDQVETKKAKEGDVVVTRVGTIGLSGRIPKECEGATISDNLIRLRFDQEKLNSHYVALFLGSAIGVSLMIRNSRGSVQQRLNQETLKEIPVPMLPGETQQLIASLVQKSHEIRTKGKELLEQAKRKVEEMVECGIDK